ncbi:MAG: DUF6261 family protein [Bacteroidales bacterium]
MKKLKVRSRTSEVDAISDRIVLLYKQKDYADAYLSNIMQSIESLSAQITTAIKRSKTLSELEDLDAIRDDHTRALSRIIEGYANFPEGEFKQIGIQLKTIFSKYSLSIVNVTYDSQSAYTESLLEDLSKISTETAKLAGITETIMQLTAANQDFVNKRVEYQKETAAQSKEINASEVKLQLINAINELGTYLEPMSKANPSMYAEFADALEKMIDDQNKVLAIRKTRNENKKLED